MTSKDEDRDEKLPESEDLSTSKEEEEDEKIPASNQKMSEDPHYPPTEFTDEEWMKVRNDLWHLGKAHLENRGHRMYWVYQVSEFFVCFFIRRVSPRRSLLVLLLNSYVCLNDSDTNTVCIDHEPNSRFVCS